MRLLVIETATSHCSVALIEGDRLIGAERATVGRGHAERLLPMIANLEGGGRADAILVDCGPGSFTGIRVGIAAGRALALGWGIPVQGFASLALIAAIDMHDAPTTVTIEGGHGEIFLARYGGHPCLEVIPPRSLPFDEAVAATTTERVVGNAAARIVAARGWGTARDVAPDAASAGLLAEGLMQAHVRPFYGREADAKPMA